MPSGAEHVVGKRRDLANQSNHHEDVREVEGQSAAHVDKERIRHASVLYEPGDPVPDDAPGCQARCDREERRIHPGCHDARDEKRPG